MAARSGETLGLRQRPDAQRNSPAPRIGDTPSVVPSLTVLSVAIIAVGIGIAAQGSERIAVGRAQKTRPVHRPLFNQPVSLPIPEAN